MKTNARTLKEWGFWNSAEVKLPEFDWGAMCAETGRNPVWGHFGAGNIFRGVIAKLQQDLLNAGLQERSQCISEGCWPVPARSGQLWRNWYDRKIRTLGTQ